MRQGKLVPRLIEKNERLDLSKIGAHHLSLRNIGNTPIRVMGIDILEPFDPPFSVEVGFAIVNTDFTIEFLSDGIINPQNRAVLWYAVENPYTATKNL